MPRLTVLPGDGIGPEIMEQTLRVLEKVVPLGNWQVDMALIGGCAIDACGNPLPQETVDACLTSDAVLLGAVGGPKWDTVPASLRPEAGLLGIRSAMGLYANLRPATLMAPLAEASPLKAEVLGDGFDLLIVRELTGGIYFGEHGNGNDSAGRYTAYDVERYSVYEIERIARTAFEAAMRRKKRLVSVDKANVLESSRLWRATVNVLAAQYPQVELSHMYVDNAAMQLVRDPGQFDVIVTSNMFGDILSDEASMLTGSIGLLPSASLGEGTRGLYEPIHGSAPDIAGSGRANPLAAILSAAMMLRYSLEMEDEARRIENAVRDALVDGARTADLAGGAAALSCREMADAVIAHL